MAEEQKSPSLEERMSNVEESVSDIQKAVTKMADMVVAVVDKGRLQDFEKKTAVDKTPQYKVSVYNGKLVTKWSALIKNRVSKDSNKKWMEEQTTELTYQDGEKEVVEYATWQRDKAMHEALKVSETIKGGVTTLTLESKEFGTFEIGLEFVN